MRSLLAQPRNPSRRLLSEFFLPPPPPPMINPLTAELNPICHLLALLGAHHILHVSRIRVNADDMRLYYRMYEHDKF